MHSSSNVETSASEMHPKEQAPDIGTIRKAIPAHCFEPNLAISFGYVLRDVFSVLVLATLALQIPSYESLPLRCILWTVYGLIQGFVFTGIWIIAHECGHGAFFKQKWLNTSIGFSLHSFLLVPYFSWKHTHSRHHRYANHMEKDTAFVPAREGALRVQRVIEKFLDITEDAPFLSLLMLLGHQLIGWPMYLLFNITAGEKSLPSSDREKSTRQSHFDPYADIFSEHERLSVAATDLGLATALLGLYLVAKPVGFSTLLMLYLVPYLWVNNWIVAITYLHHTHPEAAHYESESWTFQKGALSTIDRDFGFVGRHLFHGIIEYHVIHHLFPRIPFYHAEEATNSVRGLLGDRYLRKDSSFIVDLWTTFRTCIYVESDPKESGALRWAAPL